jgi:hypothetical protein
MDEVSSLRLLYRSRPVRSGRESDWTISFFWSHAGRVKELIPERSAAPRKISDAERCLKVLDLNGPNSEEPNLQAD